MSVCTPCRNGTHPHDRWTATAQMQAARTSRQTEAMRLHGPSFSTQRPERARHAAGHDTPLPGLLAPRCRQAGPGTSATTKTPRAPPAP